MVGPALGFKKRAPIATVEMGLEASWLPLVFSGNTVDPNKDSGQHGEQRERKKVPDELGQQMLGT